jgi:HlyD family secretion protein
MNFSSDPINTLENLSAKNKTKSISIYLVLILAILIFLIALPLIKVDISSQSRGMIRSTTDNVPLSSLVNGKVTFVQIKNNQGVEQGDTLVLLTQENLDTEKATNQDLAIDLQDRIKNLSFLGKNTSNMAILT